MSSTPYDSNVDGEDEDAEQLVTTEEALTGTSKDLPLDNDEDITTFDDLDEDDDPSKQKTSPDYNDNEMGHEEDTDGDGDESHLVEFLKKPPPGPRIEDFLEDEETLTTNEASDPPPDIMKKTDLSRPEAKEFAKYVIEVLEEDLAEYMQKTGITFPKPRTKSEKKRLMHELKQGDSISSFNSDLSDVLPGEPSKVRMTYDKGVSVYNDLSLIHLASEEMVDAEVQVNLHRAHKHEVAGKADGFSQTIEMTFLPADAALLIYKQIYPQLEDFRVKEPPTRQASQDLAMQQAKETDPNIDTKRKGPEIISLSNKKQLLQPLMDNYFKDEKLCTGSRFIGQFVNRQFFKGKYEHPTGATIESEFLNGKFHSVNHFGIVSYPRGDTFEGEWVEGRYQTGQITFCDGLKFANKDWKHCEPPDRRFKVETYYGIQPAGKTLFSDQHPPPHIPAGMYDIGDGYYNPKNGDVRGYDGFLKRKALSAERVWFEKNCRKVHDSLEQVAPKFLPERIPGSFCNSQRRVPLTKKRYH